jgi:hypothetical protein
MFRTSGVNLPQIANVETIWVPLRRRLDDARPPFPHGRQHASHVGNRRGVLVDDSTIRVCPGKAGLKVLINEGDLRETVSVGRNRMAAANEPAAQARFGPFNSTAATVEWRSVDGKPFAIIQRWQIADNDDVDRDRRPTAKPMLVVTRLPPGAVCHVAYIDVTANPDANELARKAADKDARGFKCGTDAVKVIGASGRAVELALRR